MAFNFNLGVQFKQPSSPNEKVTGDRWYDTTNNECFEWTGSSWVSCSPNYAYVLGGVSGVYRSTVHRIAFQFDTGSDELVGNLSRSLARMAGCNSSTHGYVIGGNNGAGGFTDIERFAFPFDSGTATQVGHIANQAYDTASVNNSTYGYMIGGVSSVYSTIVERFAFPFDSGNAQQTGDIGGEVVAGNTWTGHCNSSTYAYTLGAGGGVGTAKSNIRRFAFPFDSGIMQKVGVLAFATRRENPCCNSSLHGYSMGGIESGGNNQRSQLERIIFPFDSGTATHVGYMGVNTANTKGVNCTEYGYALAGNSFSSVQISNAQRFQFPFDTGVAQFTGDITVKTQPACVDNTDFVRIFV